MPDYKKKNVKRSGRAKAKVEQVKDIPMRSKPVRQRKTKENEAAEKPGDLRVVKGNKLRNRRRAQVILLVAVTVAAVILILQLSFPTGIIDQAKVIGAAIGAQSFPVSMSGSNTLNCEERGSLFYTLSDTSLESYNNGGKNIIKSQHGLSNPVLRASATRALLFDQGGVSFKIYGPKELIFDETTENSIISVNIARCGAYAIATRAKDYASTVTVYSKKGEKVYQWNSSVEIVSDVALSPDGKKLAVAVFGSNNGEYISKVYVLTFDSATPVHTSEYSGEFIYSLQTNVNKGFYVVYGGGTDYISWRKYTVKKFTTENDVRLYRGNSRHSLVVTTRSSDKKDNTLTLFNKKGESVSEIKWQQSITDATLVGNHILILSDTSIYMLDKNGKTVRRGEAGFGGVRVIGVNLEKSLVITDNLISKVDLQSEK